MFVELSEDNLDKLLEENSKVAVQYGAGWCGNCRIMKPKFKRAATNNEDITFIYADAEKFPDSRKFATVDNLPTFAVFQDGKLIEQMQGNKAEALDELIEKIK